MELIIMILGLLLVAIFFVVIFNLNYKTKAKSDTMYCSDSKNTYPKAGDVFHTLEESNIQINFLGDTDEQ